MVARRRSCEMLLTRISSLLMTSFVCCALMPVAVAITRTSGCKWMIFDVCRVEPLDLYSPQHPCRVYPCSSDIYAQHFVYTAKRKKMLHSPFCSLVGKQRARSLTSNGGPSARAPVARRLFALVELLGYSLVSIAQSLELITKNVGVRFAPTLRVVACSSGGGRCSGGGGRRLKFVEATLRIFELLSQARHFGGELLVSLLRFSCNLENSWRGRFFYFAQRAICFELQLLRLAFVQLVILACDA